MAKKRSFVPGILFTMPTPTPGTVVGGGTGQSTTDPYACSYADWLNLFAGEYDGQEGINENDYRIWFQGLFKDHDEGQEMWELCGNTGPLYDTNPNIVPMPVIEPTESPIPTVEPSFEP